MDVPVGRVVYTPVLGPKGGFRSDLTIMRLGPQMFRIVTGGAHGMTDRKLFTDLLPADGSASLTDVTGAWTTVGLWGPKARDILASITVDDVSNDGFPFATCRTLEIGSRLVLASRISYVGELGWETSMSRSSRADGSGRRREAGRPHDLTPCGIGVYGTTGRLEKCYRAFGTGGRDYTVVEAGMTRPRVKEQDVVGKEAHLRQREDEPAAILCTLTVDDHLSQTGLRRYPLGGEPITLRDGRRSPTPGGADPDVTSAGAGPSLGAYVLMAYLPPAQAVEGSTELRRRVHGRVPPETLSLGRMLLRSS